MVVYIYDVFFFRHACWYVQLSLHVLCVIDLLF